MCIHVHAKAQIQISVFKIGSILQISYNKEILLSAQWKRNILRTLYADPYATFTVR